MIKLRWLCAAVLIPSALRAQCPNGSPPPCASPPRARVERPAPASVPARAPAPNSIAVLYFENLSRDTTDQWLAEGLTEEIITRIGELDRVAVKSRYAVRQLRATNVDGSPAARALNVAFLVTGSVRRSGNRVRVTVEMARASSGDHVWGQQFDRTDGDVFAIQQDIARGVVTAVAGRLLPSETASLSARPTNSNGAYEHLLRADILLAQRTPASVRRAIAEYEAGTRDDPAFVSAWARMSVAYGILVQRSWSLDGRPAADSLGARAVASADRALSLDSTSSDTWMAQAYASMIRDAGAWSGAEQGFRRAITLNRRNAEAWHQLGDLLGALGRSQEATEAYRRALEAEPGRPITLLSMASSLSPLDRIVLCDSILSADPQFFEAYSIRAYARLAAGDTASALADRDRVLRLTPHGAELGARVVAARLTLTAGDTTVARQRARALRQEVPSTGPVHARIAVLLAGVLFDLGDTESALDLLQRAQRGVQLWQGRNVARWSTDDRIQQIFDASRPPWAITK